MTGLGFEVHDSSGTYFLCADPRPLGFDDSTAFCEELPHRAGVAAIPMSAFCDPGGAPEAWNHLVRFAFCKRDETLDEAIRRLGAPQPFLTLSTCLRRPSVAVSMAPLSVRLSRKPGIGTDGSTLRSNRTLVLSPCGVSV